MHENDDFRFKELWMVVNQQLLNNISKYGEKLTKMTQLLEKSTPWKKLLVSLSKEYSKAYYRKIETLFQISATSSAVTSQIRDVHHDPEKLRKLLKHAGRALGFCPDNGQGKTELWRVENFELAPVSPEKHGLFFGGDSYVMRYTYRDGGREKYIVYFWQV